MKKVIISITIIGTLAVCLLGGCKNYFAKQFGGTVTINLPQGTKLSTVTWEDDHLWYLTRNMKSNEQPETSVMYESSAWGIMNGKVIFNESK